MLGTVIDTYMEEAQEELRSKRVKQAKGRVSILRHWQLSGRWKAECLSEV